MYLALRDILSKIVPFTVLPMAIYSFQRFAPAPIGNTLFWWMIQAAVLMIFLTARFIFFERVNKKHFLIIDLYLYWIIFSLVRGIFMAENYWDYKTLVGRTFDLLLVIVAYVVSNKERLQSIMSFYIYYTIPLSLVVIIVQGVFMAKGVFLYPLSFLLLFLPLLKSQWKTVLIVFAILVIADGIFTGTRSLIIKFGVPFLILLLYYFRFFVATNQIIKLTHKVLLIAPWLFFTLGVSGIFNVFQIREYLNINYVAEVQTNEGVVKKQEMTQDSRTFIYREVLQSAQKYNYWILGRSPARGNETVVFADVFEEISGRNERYRNEANVPNIFTWMGIIGLLLYFLVFYKASYLAIYKSNNIFSKLTGLYVALRWAYAWVEDYSSFGINDFTIWLMIGVCFSESFRKMNNLEVKLWVRGIFEKRYITYLDYLEKKVPKKIVKTKPI